MTCETGCTHDPPADRQTIPLARTETRVWGSALHDQANACTQTAGKRQFGDFSVAFDCRRPFAQPCPSSFRAATGSGATRIQKFLRILRNALNQHLEVQVRTRGAPGTADCRNFLSPLDEIAVLTYTADACA